MCMVSKLFKIEMNISRVLLKSFQKRITFSKRYYAQTVHPFTRTVGILNDEIKSGFNIKKNYPEHADVVIIGGGFIGSSVAYWLKTRAGEGLSIVVIEKDTTYKHCSNIQSHGICSQHYSLPENIYLSQFSSEFLRNIKTHLNNDINVQFCPHSTLTLASEKYAEKLQENVEIQKEHGIKNKILTVDEIRKTYPWINTSDIDLGCISKETEGTFNSQELLRGLIQKSQELGTTYLKSEVIGFEMEIQKDVLMEGVAPGSFKKINKVIYRNEEDEEKALKFAVCVVAAGADSANIAKMASIGNGAGLLSVPLPIEKRDYNIYSIGNIPSELPVRLNTPYTMDTSGLWTRRNGMENNLICGQIPPLKENSYSVNDFFAASLNNRYPVLQNSEIKLLSNEFYDCNVYDDTGIIGPHPYHSNLMFASGFGRQGVFHAPAIGRAIGEIIIDCHFTSIDLTRFGFDRFLTNEPLIEHNMY